MKIQAKGNGMDYGKEIRATVIYIESHIYDEKPDDASLERAVGYSIAHVRDIFSTVMKVPLKSYIRRRRISRSAFDLLHSDLRIIDVALKYGFESNEAYTRAFRRELGMTPNEFRKSRLPVGKDELISGVYGIKALMRKEEIPMIKNEKLTGDGSTVLYGVPKVEYGQDCTPYPMCLKACAQYLGEDVDYKYVMAASGAAFRLTWNQRFWDLGNVDVYHTMTESNDIYGFGARAMGRSFEFLERKPDTTKEEFITFIKRHIDAGLPCIALGIIGPPEACIIAGYREEGQKLLGWNFFQNVPDFSGSVEFDDSGYFIADKWWENPDTQAVMCMGDVTGEKLSAEEITKTAIEILSGRDEGDFAKGINAYRAWKTAALDDSGIGEGATLSALYERRGCFFDAFCCLLDGRGNAAGFYSELARKNDVNSKAYAAAAKHFSDNFNVVQEMVQLMGGWDQTEENLKKSADRANREKLALLIDRAEDADRKALKALSEI